MRLLIRVTDALRLSARQQLLIRRRELSIAASSKLVDVNRERQVAVEQHTEITNAGRRLCGSAGLPAGESGVSGGGWLVEHHRTSVLVGLTVKRFAREAPRGGVRLVFCERGYTSLSVWGYCFLQLPSKDSLVHALI